VTDPRPRVLYERLGELLPEGWRDAAPWGYPKQVELALIAGVFRAQVPQASADAVVDTVMRARPYALLDDLAELASAGPHGMVEALGPRWGDTNVLGVPVLRAWVIHSAAEALVAVGVRSADDLRAAAVERPDAVEGAVLGVRGLGRGTWEWIALLAHARMRPDPEMTALVSELVGEELDASGTSELLRLTARLFASEERVLAHAVQEHLGAQTD
jgi:hypothetical protein